MISRRKALSMIGSSAGLAVLGRWQASAAEQSVECPATGDACDELSSFDDLMRNCVTDQGAPGVSIAVSRRGRLVYARGFGLADRDAHRPMQPETLLRIASISKPFTATAIMQLVEQKKLALRDRVHAVLKLDKPADPRWKTITILHLLQHTAGFDRGKSFDPMFRSVQIAEDQQVPPPAGPEHIIRYMLKQPLDFDPGERYAYSNFGYCILGRVIEHISGLPYERFVQASVLRPLGIRRMRIGRTLADQRAADEATYYCNRTRPATAVVGKIGEPVARPYGSFYLEAMDSHGAWIASAADLLRFAAAFDSLPVKRVLSPKSTAAMLSRPEGAEGLDSRGKPKVHYYGCGWDIWNFGPGDITTAHNGLLPGTSTTLVRRRDGISWAVLFNADSGNDRRNLVDSIDGPMHKAADAVKKWPEFDLFERYYRTGRR